MAEEFPHDVESVTIRVVLRDGEVFTFDDVMHMDKTEVAFTVRSKKWGTYVFYTRHIMVVHIKAKEE